jgi:hypothetical protein
MVDFNTKVINKIWNKRGTKVQPCVTTDGAENRENGFPNMQQRQI